MVSSPATHRGRAPLGGSIVRRCGVVTCFQRVQALVEPLRGATDG